ncbi:unnamed protein product, partial [Allacma fusca]
NLTDKVSPEDVSVTEFIHIVDLEGLPFSKCPLTRASFTFEIWEDVLEQLPGISSGNAKLTCGSIYEEFTGSNLIILQKVM